MTYYLEFHAIKRRDRGATVLSQTQTEYDTLQLNRWPRLFSLSVSRLGIYVCHQPNFLKFYALSKKNEGINLHNFYEL